MTPRLLTFALKAGQELQTGRASVFQAEPLEYIRLRLDEER